MNTLFGNDESLKLRDSHGRYATPERAYADKARRDLVYWKFQAEKYKRLYHSIGWLIGYKDRMILKLKEDVKRLSTESK